MDVTHDGAHTAASLAEWLGDLTFTDLSTDQTTTRVIDAIVEWAQRQSWRVYRRAPSVLPLPPPMAGRHSVLDVACARPDGPPLAIEVDHTDRRRTIEKLTAEAAAGRTAIWVRWGVAPFAAPEPPVHLVTCEVTRRSGPPGAGRLHSRSPAVDRPPPAHSAQVTTDGSPTELPLPFPEPDAT